MEKPASHWAFRYGQDCRAYGFGSICADIERKADDGGRNRVNIDADGRQAIEYDDQLYQQWRTANDGNIKFNQLQQAFLENAAGGHDPYQSNGYGNNHADNERSDR